MGCLSSVFAQQTSFPFEVIVVDNASSDDSLQVVGLNFKHVCTISNAVNKGFAAANNQGIKAATGEYILLLNPDTVLHEHCLTNLVRFMDEHREAGAVGSKIFGSDDLLQQAGVSFPSLWNVFVESLFLDKVFPLSKIFGRHRRMYDDPEQVQNVDYLQGSCLLIRRSALANTGMLDEDYFMYFEEIDLCFRLKQQNWSIIYTPSASVIHFGGSGTTYYRKQQIIFFHRSYLTFLQKHETVPKQLLFRLLLFMRAAIRAMVFVFSAVLSTRRKEFLSRCGGYFFTMQLMLGVKR